MVYLRHFPQIVESTLSPIPSITCLHWSQFPIGLSSEGLAEFDIYRETEKEKKNRSQEKLTLQQAAKGNTSKTNWDITCKLRHIDGSDTNGSPTVSTSLHHTKQQEHVTSNKDKKHRSKNAYTRHYTSYIKFSNI